MQQQRKLTLSVEKKSEFPKLTASNSLAVDGSIYYFKKDGVIYRVWEYKSGLRVRSFASKEEINQWLVNNSSRIKERIMKHEKGIAY